MSHPLAPDSLASTGSIHLIPYPGRGTLVLPMRVSAVVAAQVPALRGDEPDDVVLERLSGYPVSALDPNSRVGRVKQALAHGRRVLLVGFDERRVVRMAEVEPQSELSFADTVRLPVRGALVEFAVDTSAAAIAACTAYGRQRFAVLYRPLDPQARGVERRVRFAARLIDDGRWRNAEIVTSGGVRLERAGFCGTAEL